MPHVFQRLITIKAIILFNLTFNANTFKMPGWLFSRKLKTSLKFTWKGRKIKTILKKTKTGTYILHIKI